MRTATWMGTGAVDRAARRVLEATGRLAFDDDPGSLPRTKVAMRGVGLHACEFNLFARIVHGFTVEPLTSVEFLDSTIVHPLGTDFKRTADLAFGYAARTARRNVAILDDGSLRAAGRDTARDYPQIFVHELPLADWSALVQCGAEEIEVVLAMSDLGIATVMGAVVAPGERRGDVAIFEAALPNIECPYALILAGAQLLEFIGEGPTGDRVVKAVKRAVANGAVSGKATIDEMADAVTALLR